MVYQMYTLTCRLYTDGDFSIANPEKLRLHHDKDSYEYDTVMLFDDDINVKEWLFSLYNSINCDDTSLKEEIFGMISKAYAGIDNLWDTNYVYSNLTGNNDRSFLVVNIIEVPDTFEVPNTFMDKHSE